MAADKRARVKGRREEDGGRHVRLYHWMMDTAAWCDLDVFARCTYVEVLRIYNGSNNGIIALPVRALADKLHVSPATASRALKSLEAHGFIVVAEKGGFSRKTRHASEYRITEFPCNKTGVMPSKVFSRWQKNTVSPQKPTVSPQKPNGTRGETERAQKVTKTASTVSQVTP